MQKIKIFIYKSIFTLYIYMLDMLVYSSTFNVDFDFDFMRPFVNESILSLVHQQYFSKEPVFEQSHSSQFVCIFPANLHQRQPLNR
ncbi:hypothetical protein Hanom_Chr03g00276461 [Helianthus anomalus]